MYECTCIERGTREKCFHYEVGNTTTLLRAQERLDAMALNHPYLLDGMVQDRLHVCLADNEMEAAHDPSNIAFVPGPVLVFPPNAILILRITLK
jgi:hypothetical protein